MHDEHSSLHGHELAQFCSEPVVRGIGRDDAAVGDAGVDGVQLVDEERDDAGAIWGVFIDGNDLVPPVEFDDGDDCIDLGGVAEGGADEVRSAERGEGGTGGGERNDRDFGAVAENRHELGLGGREWADDNLNFDVLQEV